MTRAVVRGGFRRQRRATAAGFDGGVTDSAACGAAREWHGRFLSGHVLRRVVHIRLKSGHATRRRGYHGPGFFGRISRLAGTSIGLAVLPSVGYAQSPESELDPIRLAQRAAALRGGVTELVATDNLLDTLHFGWFDRPYTRATLAILLKDVAALERESHWRNGGNGASPDDVVEAMLTWADVAVMRVLQPEADVGFRPHRFHATIDTRSTISVGAPLFTFMDQCSANCASTSFGDLDLLASLGMRAYAFPPGANLVGADARARIARARSLGMAVVAFVAPDSAEESNSRHAMSGTAEDAVLTLRALTLRDLLDGAAGNSNRALPVAAIIDPAEGEPIGCSLARRAFARGALRQRRTMAARWRPAVSPGSDPAAATALTMWLHAIDGQALGVLPGWRDLRDGTLDPFGSVFTEPAVLEVVAQTALDILRLGSSIAEIDGEADFAISIDPDAIDARDPNQWAEWVRPIWAALLDRQRSFDVIATADTDPGTHKRYRLIVPLRRGDGDQTFASRVESLLTGDGSRPRHVTFVETDGSTAHGLFVREGRTPERKTCLGVVNLTPGLRTLKLRGADDIEAVRDLVAGEHIDGPKERIDLRPWQVRVLWPVD